jgi:hypothetical protein
VQSPETVQCLDLDLADAFAGDPQAPADVLERARVGIVQAVAEDDHAAVALGERSERIRERLGAQAVLEELVGERAVG